MFQTARHLGFCDIPQHFTGELGTSFCSCPLRGRLLGLQSYCFHLPPDSLFALYVFLSACFADLSLRDSLYCRLIALLDAAGALYIYFTRKPRKSDYLGVQYSRRCRLCRQKPVELYSFLEYLYLSWDLQSWLAISAGIVSAVKQSNLSQNLRGPGNRETNIS